jgi:hypothetical protein
MVRQTAQKTSNWYLHTHKEDKVKDIQEMIEAGDAAGLAQRGC